MYRWLLASFRKQNIDVGRVCASCLLLFVADVAVAAAVAAVAVVVVVAVAAVAVAVAVVAVENDKQL